MAGGKKGKKQHPPYHMEDSDEFEDAEDLGDTSIPVSGTQTQIMVQNNFHMQPRQPSNFERGSSHASRARVLDPNTFW